MMGYRSSHLTDGNKTKMADTAHNAEVEELRLESLSSNLKAIDAIFCILECFELRKKHTLERSTLRKSLSSCLCIESWRKVR